MIHKSSDFSALLIKAVSVDDLVPPNKIWSQFQRLQFTESKYYFIVLLEKTFIRAFTLARQLNESIFFKDKQGNYMLKVFCFEWQNFLLSFQLLSDNK